MKLLTVCFVCVFLLTSCSMFDGLAGRMQRAEDNLNASEDKLKEARKEFEEKQAKVDAKQADIENAISIGDLETAKALSAQLSIIRGEAAAANERVKDAEDKVDNLGDLANAAKVEYENSSTPWDYILGIIAVVGGLFGGGGILKGVSERQKRKISEENQLNPRTS